MKNTIIPNNTDINGDTNTKSSNSKKMLKTSNVKTVDKVKCKNTNNDDSIPQEMFIQLHDTIRSTSM